MPKTKEQIAKYNKEYFARPEVIARAKIRNAVRRDKRRLYKKTEKGMEADKRYRRTEHSKKLQEISRIKSRYGITLDEFTKMVEKQNGCCAICGVKPKQKLNIDHCHVTNVVRGLLCGSCNKGIGLLKDNTNFLLKAIQYLQNDVSIYNSIKENSCPKKTS